MPTPLPPPLLVPEGFNLPAPALELPKTSELQWIDPPRQPQRQPLPAPQGARPDQSTAAPISQEDLRPQPKPAAAQQVVPPAPEPPVVEQAKPEPPPPEFKEVRQFTVPIINKEIPVPATEIVVTAVTTAGASSVTAVAGTLLAQSLFKHVLRLAKPITKALAKKIASLRKKPAPLSWARARRLERHRGKSH